jgi:hypothetical protein
MCAWVSLFAKRGTETRRPHGGDKGDCKPLRKHLQAEKKEGQGSAIVFPTKVLVVG